MSNAKAASGLFRAGRSACGRMAHRHALKETIEKKRTANCKAHFQGRRAEPIRKGRINMRIILGTGKRCIRKAINKNVRLYGKQPERNENLKIVNTPANYDEETA